MKVTFAWLVHYHKFDMIVTIYDTNHNGHIQAYFHAYVQPTCTILYNVCMYMCVHLQKWFHYLCGTLHFLDDEISQLWAEIV